MIPPKYQNADYELVPQQIKDSVKKMLKGENRRGLYLHGEYGTGKTQIMYAIFKRYNEVNEFSKALFWNVTDLLQEMKNDFDKPNSEKLRPEENLMDCKDLLFLDDIGAENMTGWVAEKFYRIINHRYENMLPTFFTSNLRLGELGDKVGTAVASRIVEMCDIVELTGKDRRIEHLQKINIQL